MNSVSLWDFLEKNFIEIPLIQRDYAQGRKGKGYLRSRFLSELKDSLEKDKPLVLDFVYGSYSADASPMHRFYPLDGQQRLTTLWLLYWYIALRSGAIEDKSISKRLENFRYTVRDSSREFLSNLCDHGMKIREDDVVKGIQSQSWFFKSYLSDPTIDSMLRTLGGEKRKGADSIEGVFGDVDFQAYWDRLTKKRRITFFVLEIDDKKLPSSDRLYIKMNARGKPLSDFENFKADLLHSIGDKTSIEYGRLIDNKWTDLFWERRSADHNIDEIYFAFFNRFTLNHLLLKDPFKADVYESKEQEDTMDGPAQKSRKAFSYLYGQDIGGSGNDDSRIAYHSFDPYRNYLDEEALGYIKHIFDTYKKIDGVLSRIRIKNDPDASGQALSFLPAYSDSCPHDAESPKNAPTFTNYSGNKIRPVQKITLKGRIYFLAISEFLLRAPEGKDYEETFESWMRFVRNIVENVDVSNIPAFVDLLRQMDDWSRKGKEKGLFDSRDSFYGSLPSVIKDSRTGKWAAQLKEEREKAEEIQANKIHLKKIREAEDHAFFDGAIRFLFHDQNGNLQWSDFDRKFETAKTFFKGNTVDADAVRKFLSLFSTFDDISGMFVFHQRGSSDRGHCWKNDVLLSSEEKMIDAVHRWLLRIPGPSAIGAYSKFLASSILEGHLLKAYKSERYRFLPNYYHGFPCLYREYCEDQGMILSEQRIRKSAIFHDLAEEGKIVLIGAPYYDNGLYFAINMPFTYKGQNKKFLWYYDDKVYRCDSSGRPMESKWVTWSDGEDLLSKLDTLS